MRDPETFEPLLLGSSEPVSGQLVLTCTPDDGGASATVSMPLTISATPPPTIYNSPTAWTWYTPDDMTTVGAVVTINALGFKPGESATLSLVNETMWSDNSGDFTGAMAGPVSVTADGEGAVTAQVAVPGGWVSDDGLILNIAGTTSRYLMQDFAGGPTESDSSGITTAEFALPGDTVEVTASGFEAGETVVVALHSTAVAAVQLGTLTADGAGAVAGSVSLPPDIAPGSYRLWTGAKTIGYLLLNAPLAIWSETPSPVYRFWSSTKKSHFYTASLAERDHVIAAYDDSEWLYEGVAYDADETVAPGTAPLYRFWSQTFQGHFYTVSEAEKDHVIATYPNSVWQYEGVAFYVLEADDGHSSPVFRFWSPNNRHHFYTASAAEAAHVDANYSDAEWTPEGEVYWVKITE